MIVEGVEDDEDTIISKIEPESVKSDLKNTKKFDFIS